MTRQIKVNTDCYSYILIGHTIDWLQCLQELKLSVTVPDKCMKQLDHINRYFHMHDISYANPCWWWAETGWCRPSVHCAVTHSSKTLKFMPMWKIKISSSPDLHVHDMQVENRSPRDADEQVVPHSNFISTWIWCIHFLAENCLMVLWPDPDPLSYF